MRVPDLNHFHFPVSFGTILVSWNAQGLLTRIEWSETKLAVFYRVRVPASVAEVVDQIRGYFYQGEPLDAILWEHLDQSDWSPFQRQVYQAISTIPHGQTRTYGWVAQKMGNAFASRAVGQALKRNPLPILIPCHRVLANRSLGGFMGATDPLQAEIQLKQKLLQLEEQYQSPVFSFLSSDTRLSSSVW